MHFALVTGSSDLAPGEQPPDAGSDQVPTVASRRFWGRG